MQNLFDRSAAILLTMGLVLLLTAVSVEFLWIRATQDVQGPGWILLTGCWLNAFVGWLQFVPALMIVFVLAAFLSIRAAQGVLIGIILLLLLAQVILTVYFARASVPLGADLYGYSWADIRQTVGSAGGISWMQILLALLGLTAAGLALFAASRWSKMRRFPRWTVWAAAAAGIVVLLTGWPQWRFGESEFARNLSIDKTNYFLRQTWRYVNPAEAETDIYSDSYIAADAAPERRRRHYISTDLPFLTSDTVADVLSPFLRKDDRPPHLVIILVEGLGRAFTNDGAYLGNFTPFLDSLSRQSLYWDNFLSGGGRTFAALPSVLGSLPFARQGFLALGGEMPATLSLDAILRADGYRTSFYYGGDAEFDNMSQYLRHEAVDEIKDGGSFPAGYQRIPAQNGFSWGYNDHELLRWWLTNRTDRPPAPQLSVILTVSTHSPFLLNDAAAWQDRFERRMTELGFDETARQTHRLYRDQYASILYTDDALRSFFAAYARRPDFAHTVFLITGDHRMPEIPMRDKIDRFHVPLIVYSPLLKRTAVFHSVSSHLDITPSILAWLQHAYGLPAPSQSAWIGDGLDTSESFRDIHATPLMQTKTDLVDYVAGEDHLNNGVVYRLHADLSEDIVADDSVRAAMQAGMDAYRQRNAAWLQTRSLWPDSVIKHYRR